MGSDAPRPMAFFRRCWEYARDGRDVEASDVQDWGEEFGLLTKVSVAAPCGEDCYCEEYYGEFPVDCYRPVEGQGSPTPAMIDAAARALWVMGNARIGARTWESVASHYRQEAEAALRAALTAQDLPTEQQPAREAQPKPD